MLSLLDQIECLKNPAHKLNIEYLSMNNSFYEKLLILFGYNQFYKTIKDFAIYYEFPEKYRCGNEERITHIAI